MGRAQQPESKVGTLRVVVVRDSGAYLAQCIDYDIAAQGQTPDEAMQAFTRVYIRHILTARHFGDDPFGDRWREVPAEYPRMWHERIASGNTTPQRFTIPPFKIRKRQGLEGGAGPNAGDVPREGEMLVA